MTNNDCQGKKFSLPGDSISTLDGFHPSVKGMEELARTFIEEAEKL